VGLVSFIIIMRRYRTIAMYKIDVTDEEKALVSSIKQTWDDLLLNAKVGWNYCRLKYYRFF